MNAFWIILTGSLVAVTAGLLGCFLILRKMAMVGDAIAHAVLPGIVIAFLISGSRDSVLMLTGAAATGLLTTFIIEYLQKTGKLQSDAAIGLAFTFMFAVGVILIAVYAGQIDLDQDCVLHGEIAYVPLETIITDSGYNLGPTAIWYLGAVFIAVLCLIIFGYKGLMLTTFDPEYAAAIGISTAAWHYVLMAAVSLATVVSFESVGAILVVAFLVAPPAIAYLLTDSLPRMLVISSIAGILAAIGGYYLAATIDGSIAGAMTVVLGIEFIIVFIFSPKYGLIRNG